MRTLRLELSLLASCVLLSACGGGGGGSAPAAAPVATQLQLLAGHIGGGGDLDGVGSMARFIFPSAAARAPSGEVYVADTGNHLIRRIDADGKVSVWAGSRSGSGYADGERISAQFSSPSDIAMGSDGTVYVLDSGNNVIRAISLAGTVRTLAGQVSQPGNTDGVGASAQFFAPVSLQIEPSGSLLVVQRNGVLRTVTPEGAVATVKTSLPEGLRITGAGMDKAGNRLIAGRFGSESGAALYRLDGDGNAILLTGNPSASGANDGESASARFGTITGVVADSSGNLLIADDYSELRAGGGFVMQDGGTTIRKLSTNGMVSTLAGRYRASGSADGDSATGQLCGPSSIKLYDNTSWLVADKCNHTIRLVGADGELKTLAGMASSSGNTNGAGDQARFSQILGIATTQDGNTYVTDFANSNIRRISASGQTSVAVSLDSITGPTLLTNNGPTDICFADRTRVTFHSGIAIRCMGPDGTVRHLTNSFSGNASYFTSVNGMAPDRQGNLLIADGFSGALRSISNAGTTTTMATDLKSLGAIATGPGGVVYMKIGNSIQRRTSDGSLALVAGSPDIAGQQNGTGPDARFTNINALAIDTQNYLYVADGTTIRLISPAGEVSTLAGTPGQYGIRLGNAPGSLAPINGLAVAIDQKSLLASTTNAVIRITLQR